MNAIFGLQVNLNIFKVKGMNAIFGLQVNLALGDRQIVALATGTAVYIGTWNSMIEALFVKIPKSA